MIITLCDLAAQLEYNRGCTGGLLGNCQFSQHRV